MSNSNEFNHILCNFTLPGGTASRHYHPASQDAFSHVFPLKKKKKISQECLEGSSFHAQERPLHVRAESLESDFYAPGAAFHVSKKMF